MEKSLRQFLSAAVCGLLLASASLGRSATPQVTADGLHRLHDSVMQQAWVKPGVDLSGYTRIMVLPTSLSFKEVPRFSRDEFPITEGQKQALLEVVPDALGAELVKLTGYTLTDKPGRDVLVVWGGVLDIASRIPPEPVGRGASFVRTLGEATLVVELRDSMTDEVVARAVDHRSVSPAFVRRSTSVSNEAEVRNAARRWAADLRRQLDEFARL
jgi:hypothetical protein